MRRRKQKFFGQNPVCCFCGGAKEAVQRDHIPPKCVFQNKNLPGNADLIEFPACNRWNQGWRLKDEAIAAVSILCGCKNCDTEENAADLTRASNYLKRSDIAKRIIPTENLTPTFVMQNNLIVRRLKAEFKWKEFFV